MTASLTETAPAKINLTLRVLRRRPDGYHDLDSLVAFADGISADTASSNVADVLTLDPGAPFGLDVTGPGADACGDLSDNLVRKAADALAARVPGLRPGRFGLDKRLPVAAGLGGGSADAAAALRLLGRAHGLAADDARVAEAARAVGADVPVCLAPVARVMRGIGHDLSPPAGIAPLPAVLVHPGVALPTREVFAALERIDDNGGCDAAQPPQGPQALRGWLAAQRNDLEPPAITLRPVIGAVLAALRESGAQIARMSGSGATCFGIFANAAAAQVAAQALARRAPDWWVRPTLLR